MPVSSPEAMDPALTFKDRKIIFFGMSQAFCMKAHVLAPDLHIYLHHMTKMCCSMCESIRFVNHILLFQQIILMSF